MILRQLVNLILSLLWKSTNFPGISVKSHKGRPKRNRLTPSPAKKPPGISEGQKQRTLRMCFKHTEGLWRSKRMKLRRTLDSPDRSVSKCAFSFRKGFLLWLNSPTNWIFLKRIVPVFHDISVYIIKRNVARIHRQNNRKRLIAVNVNYLSRIAIIHFQLCYLLLIHRNKRSFFISLYCVFCNSSVNA